MPGLGAVSVCSCLPRHLGTCVPGGRSTGRHRSSPRCSTRGIPYWITRPGHLWSVRSARLPAPSRDQCPRGRWSAGGTRSVGGSAGRPGRDRELRCGAVGAERVPAGGARISDHAADGGGGGALGAADVQRQPVGAGDHPGDRAVAGQPAGGLGRDRPGPAQLPARHARGGAGGGQRLPVDGHPHVRGVRRARRADCRGPGRRGPARPGPRPGVRRGCAGPRPAGHRS